MTVQVNSSGDMEVRLTAKDDASPVVEDFAKNTASSLEKSAQSVQNASSNSTEYFAKRRAEMEAWRKSVEETASKTVKASEDQQKAAYELGVSIGNGLKGTAGALVAVAASVAMTGMKMGDAQQKLSEKLGVTVDWLGKMQYAAGLINADDKLPNWVKLMERNLAQAAETGKGITSVIEQLGLDVQKLKESGPERAFQSIVEAIDKIPDPMERTRVSMAVFGRGAEDAARIGKAIRDAGDDAHNFNRLFTADGAAGSNKFFDQLYRFGELLKGLPVMVANDVAKPFAEMAKIFVNFAAESGVLKGVARVLIEVLAAIGAVVVTVGTAFALVGKSISGFSAVLGNLLTGNWREAMNAGQAFIEDLSDTVKKFVELQSDLAKRSAPPTGEPGAPTGPGQGQKGGGKASKSGFVKSAFTPNMKLPQYSDLPGSSGVLSDIDQLGNQARIAAQAAELSETEAHQKRMVDAYVSYENTKLEVQRQSIAYTEAMWYAARQGDLMAMGYFFQQAEGLMKSKSRVMFEIGKGAAIASAMVDMGRAIMSALATQPFFPVGLGMAALAAAKGITTIQQIKSVQFGGAAATPTFSASPATGLPASSAVSVPGASGGAGVTQAAQRNPRTMNITLVGSAFSASSVRDELIPLLQDASNDGMTINVRTA